MCIGYLAFGWLKSLGGSLARFFTNFCQNGESSTVTHTYNNNMDQGLLCEAKFCKALKAFFVFNSLFLRFFKKLCEIVFPWVVQRSSGHRTQN